MSLLSSSPTTATTSAPSSVEAAPVGWTDRWIRRAVEAVLHQVNDGRITLVEGGRAQHFGDEKATDRAEIVVHDPRFFRRLAFGGGLGAADSYVAREWSCDDLTTLLRIVARSPLNEGIDGGWSRVRGALERVAHFFRRNNRAGSRRNIAAHYDLSNDFFSLFLDDTLSYSSLFFEDANEPLEDAARRKLDRIAQKLDLRPSDHVLEIGTGWGGLAIHFAREYGCRVTTTTISKEQYDEATKRVAAAGLEDRIELLLEDYRDVKGTYDKLVSVEMIEAVGAQYFDEFFRVCRDRLTDDGRMLIQAITIAERHYERARDSVDFIKRDIFPGCCIPSLGALGQSITRSRALDWVDVEDIGAHYAVTLRRWLERFHANWSKIHPLGFDDEFARRWEYYLCYCEAGFLEEHIRNHQIVLAKPGHRQTAPMGGRNEWNASR